MQDTAADVILHGGGGYSDSVPLDAALGPDALLAYAMQDETLAIAHGFPCRLFIPNLYGEKNVKWVTRIEVIDHDARGFYEQQGWGPSFVIPTRSDIFGPRWVRKKGDAFVEPFAVGKQATIRGRAFAGNRGIQRALGDAHGLRTDGRARVVEGLQGGLDVFEHERLHDGLVVFSRVDFEFNFRVFVETDAIFELQLLQSLLVIVSGGEVLAGCEGRIARHLQVYADSRDEAYGHPPGRKWQSNDAAQEQHLQLSRPGSSG